MLAVMADCDALLSWQGAMALSAWLDKAACLDHLMAEPGTRWWHMSAGTCSLKRTLQ